MIVPMKNVTLLTQAKDEAVALEALRDLGVMQIVPAERRSVAAQNSADALSAALRSRALLEKYADEGQDDSGIRPGDPARGRAVIEQADALADRKLELEMSLGTVRQRLNRLAVWGEFKLETLDALRAKGVEVLLCSGSREDFENAGKLENVTVFPVNENKGSVDFAAVITGGDAAAAAGKLPVFKLAPDDDPAKLRKQSEELSGAITECENGLKKLSSESAAVEAYCAGLADAADFDRAADAMREYGEISVLCGYVPVPELDALRAVARENGWGLLLRDPAEDEDVPVLIKDNRFTRVIKPLFDFLGIVPGYRELDISGGILVFFTIFYAIIIGDAGYGILFGLVSLFGLKAAKSRPSLRQPMKLLLVLSCAATVWGALCGSWFGMSDIPWTGKPFPALECFRNFSSNAAKQANIQLFCFILALIQLSLGRMWRAFSERNWRAIGQHTGWMLIIWGNFFLTVRLIVYPGDFPEFMYALYGVGLLLVMICGVNWKNAADIFQFPFDIIGSFTDVLSYIRLFAVGLAGACIAGSFNGMAFDLCQVSAWMLPAGAVVLLIGHALNIALAFLSVLVHAVRLNTLEFSNHTGLSWSGQSFNPFKKINKDKE